MEYINNARVGTLCYVMTNEKMLLLHRNKKKNDVHEGKWIGLGGKIEKGETPRECVQREVFEESGLNIPNPQLRGIISFPCFTDGYDWTVFLYIANEFHGELIDSYEGELEWVDKEQVLSMPTWDGDLIFLKEILEDNRFFEAKFEYDDSGELIKWDIFK